MSLKLSNHVFYFINNNSTLLTTKFVLQPSRDILAMIWWNCLHVVSNLWNKLPIVSYFYKLPTALFRSDINKKKGTKNNFIQINPWSKMCKWSQASFDQARINTMVSLEIKTLAAMSEEMRENSEMENIQIKKKNVRSHPYI